MCPIVLPESRKLVYEEVIPPKTGFSTIVKKGQYFRIIDLMGKQMVDVAFFNVHNTKEKHSNIRSLARQFVVRPQAAYRIKDKLTTGDIIISTAFSPMMTIVADTPVPGGVHKVFGPSCSKELYEFLGYPDHPGCLDILADLLAKYGVSPEEIPDTFDVFMNIEHDVAAGEWRIKEPVSRPGDYIEFRAEMDCIVALSNCPFDVDINISANIQGNGGVCTPIKVEIYE